MRIAALQISGFRGIKEAKLVLTPHTVFIGPNNAGKTTIIESLALLLGRDRMVRSLTEHDFFNSSPAPTDRIKVVAAVGGFSPNDPDAHPQWFSARRGVPKWLDPKTGDVSAARDGTFSELVCELALLARFDADTLDVEAIRYFQDDPSDDPFEDESVATVPQALVQELGFFLISARRSWDRVLSFGYELFRRVISATDGLPASSILKARDELRAPQNPLESDPKLQPVIAEVETEMAALFGGSGKVRLRITPTDSDGVMDAVTPHFEQSGVTAVPASRQGSGLISLQSLFLLLHFGKRRLEEGKGFIIALEEPELHLPPAVQRRVLHRLQALSSQTIITTHSPLVAGFAQPTELRLVRNSAGDMSAKPMLQDPLTHASTNAMRRIFQLGRVAAATALMGETVVVPEGELDFSWLQLLQRATELDVTEGGSEFGIRIGLAPSRSDDLEAIVATFAAAHPAVCVLVDGDAQGRSYATKFGDAKSGAARVLRWCDGWTIEDVIGWIVKADDAAVLGGLSADLIDPPTTVDLLVSRLKTDAKTDPSHLKGDRVAYEAIAAAIGESSPARRRTRELLDAVATAARGEATPKFVVAEGGAIAVFSP